MSQAVHGEEKMYVESMQEQIGQAIAVARQRIADMGEQVREGVIAAQSVVESVVEEVRSKASQVTERVKGKDEL